MNFRLQVAPTRITSLTATGVFDASWYRDTYLTSSDWDGNPEVHFKTRGAWQGHQPNRFFDTKHYLAGFPSLHKSKVDPLTHYLEYGERNGATPNSDFDPAWYAATYPSYSVNAWGAFAHFCAFGWRMGLGTYKGQLDQIDQICSEMRADKLFDSDIYCRLNPDITAAGIDPVRHYAEHGSREGRQPHPLFDIGFYLDQIPSKKGGEENVMWHYARVGSALNINPNIWFDSAWYKRQYGPLMRQHETPVAHFVRVGGYLTNPSVFFDAIRYRRSYAAPPRGLDPLSDFMLNGMDLGRPAPLTDDDSVSEARASVVKMRCLKRSPLGVRPIALFVTFAAAGRIKGHVPSYVEALARQGIDVVLIVAAPEPKTIIPESLIKICAAVYVRENAGFDFAAWAHVITTEPGVLLAPILYLTNDSIVGPVNQNAFANVIEAIGESDEDVVGLTDNRFYAWHLQSFLIAIKHRCLISEAFQAFWRDVVNKNNKDAVIRAYEITFTARLVAAGFSAKALFPMETKSPFAGNRTILDWKGLLDQGFPFVKASLLIGEHRKTAGVDVRKTLNQRGFETRNLDRDYEHSGSLIEASHLG